MQLATAKPIKISICTFLINRFFNDYVLFVRSNRYSSVSVHTNEENVEMMQKMIEQIRNNKNRQTEFEF